MLPYVKLLLKAKREPEVPVLPPKPGSFGEHLRKRRLELKLSQKDLAQRIGVSKDTVRNWERNRSLPSPHYIPPLIEFLGYNPFDLKVKSFGERLKLLRRLSGLSQRELAEKIGIDPTTIWRWEKEKGKPSKKLLKKLEELFP